MEHRVIVHVIRFSVSCRTIPRLAPTSRGRARVLEGASWMARLALGTTHAVRVTGSDVVHVVVFAIDTASHRRK